MPLYMYQAAYTPESWAAQMKNPQIRAEAVGAGGAIKASKTTVLMTGEQGVTALNKADAVAKSYRPA